MTEKTALRDQLSERWKTLSPEQQRYSILGGVILVALVVFLWVLANTPAIRPLTTTQVQPDRPDVHVFGGGRSNIQAIEDLHRRVEAEARANREMRERQDRALKELEEVKDAFVNWTRSTGIEREAAQARSQFQRMQRRAQELERMLAETESRAAGIEPFDPTTRETPSRQPEEVGDEVAPDDFEQPTTPTPRPEPRAADDLQELDQDLFAGVGTTPRSERTERDRRRAEPSQIERPDVAPPSTPRQLIVNGRAIQEIKDERERERLAALEARQDEPNGDEPVPRPDGGTRTQRRRQTVDDQLPAASILSGVLLHGMDAPTGTGARGQPVPILIRVKDLAIIPNHRSMDLEDCHVIGEGFGSMSEERAFGRLLDLVCTNHEGEIIHASMQGYIVGPDGRVGIRGPVVQRNGALIARSLQAGVLSGFGQAVGGRRSGAISITTGGGRVTDSLGDVAEESIARGVGSAMENIAQFYLRQAEAIFPVIEISPEIPVDMVLTGPLVLNQ
jgi:hypothetical protein